MRARGGRVFDGQLGFTALKTSGFELRADAPLVIKIVLAFSPGFA